MADCGCVVERLESRAAARPVRGFCGSSTYAAPEVIRGGECDALAAGMWSLGVRLFGMLRSLCVITALLVLGSGAMRLCRPVVVIGGACMAVGTHSIFLVPEEALRKHARRLLLPVPRRQKERNTDRCKKTACISLTVCTFSFAVNFWTIEVVAPVVAVTTTPMVADIAFFSALLSFAAY